MTITRASKPKLRLTLLLLALIAAMTFLWIRLAPPGVAGKLLAVGYSVCHQIAAHTYRVNGMLLPLCSRCTGLFLGALSTLAILSTQNRRGGFPKAKFARVLFFFFLAYLADGVNSMLTMFNGLQGLYPPSNLLRLITGVLMGIDLGVLVMSLWNQILWSDATEAPLLSSYRLLALCLAAGGVIVLLVISDLPLLYYPLALFSTSSVIVLLAMVYTMLWTLMRKKENTLQCWQDHIWAFLLGGLTAMTQIALMDGLRLSLTHTWAGFML